MNKSRSQLQPAMCESRRFITVFTKARYSVLFWSRLPVVLSRVIPFLILWLIKVNVAVRVTAPLLFGGFRITSAPRERLSWLSFSWFPSVCSRNLPEYYDYLKLYISSFLSDPLVLISSYIMRLVCDWVSDTRISVATTENLVCVCHVTWLVSWSHNGGGEGFATGYNGAQFELIHHVV